MENLRTAFKTSDKLGKVVMLTGRKGGIGKTTDNDLLAIVSSQLFEKDVLLIDYDNKEILLPTLDQRIKLLALIDPCLQQSKKGTGFQVLLK